MWKLSSRRIVRMASTLTVATVVSLAVLACAGAVESAWARSAGQETEALRIEVTLDEYSFSPDPLRIPAGRPITLVIRNVGKAAHEFMAGRDVEGSDFKYDLFADLHVNIEQVDMADTGHGEHAEHAHAEAAEHEHGDVEHEDTTAGTHAHGEGHEHGTMVEAQASQTFHMTFTLPESRRGEWNTGCFLPGHYDAGMHGTLIVE